MPIPIAALAVLSGTHLPACASYLVHPTAAEHIQDAALVGRAAKRAAEPSSIGAVIAGRGWRIVWAAPANSEPGVFFFRGTRPPLGFVDVWGGPADTQGEAARWAAQTAGAPEAVARCFAEALIEKGP